MSCRWSHQIPHPDDVCLDCEVLAPEKCVEHGEHEGHAVSIEEHPTGPSGYYCGTCNDWLRPEWSLTSLERST